VPKPEPVSTLGFLVGLSRLYVDFIKLRAQYSFCPAALRKALDELDGSFRDAGALFNEEVACHRKRLIRK
jgi:hypothetical protein